jgi:hypothetical protein
MTEKNEEQMPIPRLDGASVGGRIGSRFQVFDVHEGEISVGVAVSDLSGCFMLKRWCAQNPPQRTAAQPRLRRMVWRRILRVRTARRTSQRCTGPRGRGNNRQAAAKVVVAAMSTVLPRPAWAQIPAFSARPISPSTAPPAPAIQLGCECVRNDGPDGLTRVVTETNESVSRIRILDSRLLPPVHACAGIHSARTQFRNPRWLTSARIPILGIALFEMTSRAYL